MQGLKHYQKPSVNFIVTTLTSDSNTKGVGLSGSPIEFPGKKRGARIDGDKNLRLCEGIESWGVLGEWAHTLPLRGNRSNPIFWFTKGGRTRFHWGGEKINNWTHTQPPKIRWGEKVFRGIVNVVRTRQRASQSKGEGKKIETAPLWTKRKKKTLLNPLRELKPPKNVGTGSAWKLRGNAFNRLAAKRAERIFSLIKGTGFFTQHLREKNKPENNSFFNTL